MKKKREFRKTYHTCYAWLFSWVYQKVGRSEDAEDICQEVFIRLFRNFEKVDPLKRWAWIKTAARYEISNFTRRKQYVNSNCGDISAIDESRIPAEREDDILIRLVLEEIIGDESTYSDELEKSVFHLIALCGYSVKEAAEELGLTRRKTRYRYSRVSRKIVDKLKKKDLTGIEDII